MGVMRRALRTFNAASLTANFQDIGAVVPFTTWRATFINTSDVDVLITDQSSQEDIRVPSNGTISISELTFGDGNNRTPDALFDANTTLQIKQVTAAGTGTIIIVLLGKGG